MLRILLTNDDGIDAPGIHALHESVRHALQMHRPHEDVEIIAVAPDRCRSECGHSIVTSHPLTIKSVRENWYSVDGTPVDCIRVAHYAMDFQPDIVFSGINAGANLGVNLMISGTFAAAREACLLGIPAMAASHYRRPDVPRTWDHTPIWLEQTIGEFLRAAAEPCDDHRAPPLWNVNLPAVSPDLAEIPERTECDVDRCPIDRTGRIEPGGRVRFELDFHGRPREPGRDVQHCFDGRITISKLGVHPSR
ncbi:5'-nucleotidase SurE [Stieleria maiorica]|uniref:5'-nucleotidase n=1 Tax=Stieleria maiorica TaxID=2795974 RepID=A0A5B9MCH7_9BACT|nr:5'/3'-nucleotidase SurE [Stieleria maiorica]QEF96937.1 5'-nucleotidase SurE [Stieleria maiorica]